MIFGAEAPRFIYKHRLPGEVIVDLDYAVMQRHEVETDYVEHVEELTGNRKLLFRRTNRTIVIVLNLFKYADPLVTYNLIALYKEEAVALYLHRDGEPFALIRYGDVIVDAPFILKEITPFFLESATYRDGLVLVFESAAPSGAFDNIFIAVGVRVPLFDADGLPVYDADGKRVYVYV